MNRFLNERLIYILTLAILCFSFGYYVANAEVLGEQNIQSQTINTNEINEFTGIEWFIPLGQIGGTYENLEFYSYYNRVSGSITPSFQITEFTDGTYTTTTGNNLTLIGQALSGGFDNTYSATSSIQYLFNPTKYYAIISTFSVSFSDFVKANSSNDLYYVFFGDEVQTEDILYILYPENATTTASTTIDLIFQYNNVNGLYSEVDYVIKNNYTFLNTVQQGYFSIDSNEGFLYASTTLEAGTYQIEAYLFNPITQAVQSYVVNNFTVYQSILPDIIGFDPIDYDTITGLATTTCSFSNISGCFQNALVLVFYPSQDALTNFENLKETISKKAPFGYFTLLTGILDNFSESATPVFALEEEDNITSNIFDPLRTGMTWILWIVFGLWLYKRITHIDV